jgi:hypothetical protein
VLLSILAKFIYVAGILTSIHDQNNRNPLLAEYSRRPKNSLKECFLGFGIKAS